MLHSYLKNFTSGQWMQQPLTTHSYLTFIHNTLLFTGLEMQYSNLRSMAKFFQVRGQ